MNEERDKLIEVLETKFDEFDLANTTLTTEEETSMLADAILAAGYRMQGGGLTDKERETEQRAAVEEARGIIRRGAESGNTHIVLRFDEMERILAALEAAEAKLASCQAQLGVALQYVPQTVMAKIARAGREATK